MATQTSRCRPDAASVRFLAVAGVVVLTALVALVLVYVPPVGSPLPSRSANLVTGPIGVAACWMALRRLDGDLRRAWTLFAVAMLMMTTGDVLSVGMPLADAEDPMIQVLAFFYLGALVPAAAGLVKYPFLTARDMWRVLLVDVAVLLCAVLLLVYLFVLRDLYAADLAVSDRVALSIYPVGAALLASLVALALLRTEGAPRLDLLVGCVLMMALFVTGTSNGFASLPGADPRWARLSDVSYGVTPVLVAVGAYAASTRSLAGRVLRRHLTGVVRPLVPDLAALMALCITIVVATPDPGTVVLGAVTLAAVGLRQMSQTASGERLRGELEDVVDERTEELDELTEAYRVLEAMKLEFVTAVSHELRTPLASIRGSLEMLRDGDAGELPRPALSMIKIAGRGSERLTRLVNDIIDLERLESGTFGFSPGRHDVPALVGDAVRSLDFLALDGSVQIHVEAEEGAAWCDADRITQVLVNLLGNALKFAPRGSTITVAARGEEDHVLFAVSDQGPGIPATDLETIFDRFHQVEMDESRQRGGAGLGLTICRHIIQRHGGRIWAENTVQGARISFTVPVGPLVQSAPGRVGA